MINKLPRSKEGGGAFTESFNSGACIGSIHPDAIDLRTDVKVIKLFLRPQGVLTEGDLYG
jgi:hypothetical protein